MPTFFQVYFFFFYADTMLTIDNRNYTVEPITVTWMYPTLYNGRYNKVLILIVACNQRPNAYNSQLRVYIYKSLYTHIFRVVMVLHKEKMVAS